MYGTIMALIAIIRLSHGAVHWGGGVADPGHGYQAAPLGETNGGELQISHARYYYRAAFLRPPPHCPSSFTDRGYE